MCKSVNGLGRRFLAHERGNVAILFALMAIPLFAIMGGAIDYARAYRIRSQLQSMLDAGAVAAAVAYRETGDRTQAEQRLRDFLAASLSEEGMSLGQAQGGSATGQEVTLGNAVIDPSTASLAPTLTTKVDTTVLSLIGINSIDVGVETRAALAGKKLELSLMLDITGSMCNGSVSSCTSGTKLDNLKYAANDLIDMFKTNMNAGATRIALVPFSETVNVGSYANAVRGTYTSGTCTTPGCQKYKFKDQQGGQLTYAISTCVTERTGAQAYTDEPPTTAFVGRNYPNTSGTCKPSNTILPLTNDVSLLKTTVNGFSAQGGTAGHIGTAWAWYMLSPKWGYLWPVASQPEQPDPDKLIKAAILMTDGDYNLQYCNGVDDGQIKNCSAPNGTSSQQAAQLCTKMKTDGGIVVYTVGFGITPGSPQETLLKNCASDKTKYFFPYNGDQLRETFREIGRQLAAGQAGVLVTK